MITRKNKLEVGKTYLFAGYSWTVCELVNNGKVAVIQSHGVTHGAWPGYKMLKFGRNVDTPYGVNIAGADISTYDAKMQELYDTIKKVEATHGKGLYLIDKEQVGFTEFGLSGSGNYYNALLDAAKNACLFGTSNHYVWTGSVYLDGSYAWTLNYDDDIFLSNCQNFDFVIAPAFNLDVSKIEVIGSEIVIKGKGLKRLYSFFKKINNKGRKGIWKS